MKQKDDKRLTEKIDEFKYSKKAEETDMLKQVTGQQDLPQQ